MKKVMITVVMMVVAIAWLAASQVAQANCGSCGVGDKAHAEVKAKTADGCCATGANAEGCPAKKSCSASKQCPLNKDCADCKDGKMCEVCAKACAAKKAECAAKKAECAAKKVSGCPTCAAGKPCDVCPKKADKE